MYIKKYILFILLAAVAFTGCRTGTESKEPEAHLEQLPEPVKFDLPAIKERGYLTAIVDNSSTGYFIYKGQPMGYEYELLQLLAKNLGVELKIKVIPSMEQAFRMLQLGEGDIVAYSLTITKARKEHFAFTDSHYSTRQVLVQRKPENWRSMALHEIDQQLIRDPMQLMGKEVHVRKGSSYVERLQNLSHEIGGDIIIIEEDKDTETEEMILNLLDGKYDYIVADETVAKVNAAYYPDIDVKTAISFPQRIAWALRKNSPQLQVAINKWMNKMKKEPTFNVIYNRYFNNNRISVKRIKSDYHSKQGSGLSPYDTLLKMAADTLKWDWRLLASQMFQESRFNPDEKSWAGAVGLFQIMPETGAMYGYTDLYNPQVNINAAIAHINYLDKHWSEIVPDSIDRKKIILGSYNVGLGHILDARALARKYGEDDSKWDVIAKYLLLKSKPEYYQDPVVKSGYARGSEPVKYVSQIINRYNQYRQMIRN
ncbi:MAG: transporter substrate-binding domain-containing protein [Candidatus Cyclobacteriaceae bacterium M2_1C_046]